MIDNTAIHVLQSLDYYVCVQIHLTGLKYM